MPEYVERFGKAFPGEDDAVTFDNMARAIEAFEATLVTPASPFDAWIEGNDAAMSADQKIGLDLFIGRGCTACHTGVNVGGQDYHSGQVWDLEQAVSVMGTAQLGTELSGDEAAKIVAFLEALTGEQPVVEYPIMPVETADTPKPQL